jgi:hypothetical protein
MFFQRKPRRGYHIDSGFRKCEGPYYTETLQAISKEIQPEWYLEIGTRDGRSLRAINTNFIAVDPKFAITKNTLNAAKQFFFFQETSDAFFQRDFMRLNNIQPGLAFIDGMHLFEFVLRDFINIEKAMDPDGAICLHDVLPFNADMTTRNIDYLEKLKLPWTGDVWKILPIFKKYRPDLEITILDSRPTGLGLVRNLDPESRVLSEQYGEIIQDFTALEISGFGIEEYYSLYRIASM